MRTDWSRIIGWAIPLICIAIAGVVIYNQHAAFDKAAQDLSAARTAEAAASVARDRAEQEAGTVRYAAVPPSTSEEPKFLNGLRSRATLSGIQISRWTSQTAPATSTNGQPPAETDPAVKSLVKIQGDMTLSGPYQGIRKFLLDLSLTNRLYTLSNLRWTLKNGTDVELQTMITRYVDPNLKAEPTGDGTTDAKGKKRT